MVAPPAPELVQMGVDLLAEGTELAPGIGSDVADPDVVESAYQGTPIAPFLSLATAAVEVEAALPTISCPVLLLISREDHVLTPEGAAHFEEVAAGPFERVWLERSYHVATLDYDRELIEERVAAFVRQVTAP
jgi:carboxylesterase